jgi:NAD-dependent DNA ligase
MIQLVRSGDVIPHIMGVTQSSEKPKLPCMPIDQYRWNDTHVDFMLVNKKQNKIVVEKNIVGFFKGLGVECLGPGNIRKIIEAGYDTIPKIIAMTTEDLLTIPTFKEKMATKIHTNIHETLNTIDLPTIMHASNVFGRGFGVKKLKPILQAIPTILSSQPQQPSVPSTTAATIHQVESIKGMAHKTSKRFVQAIPAFIAFIHETKHPYLIELITTPYSTNQPTTTLASSSSSSSSTTHHPLHGKKIVLTGFRDKALVKEIESFGGIHTSSVSKNTFVVLVKDIDEDTGKAEQAREKNIPIMTAEAFRKKYL